MVIALSRWNINKKENWSKGIQHFQEDLLYII
jgi:hypothetical protein